MSKESWSRTKLPLVAVVVLWAACVATSIVGFQHQWGRYPDTVDVAVGSTVLAPFAMPKAFGDLVGITALNSTRGTLLMMAGFWPVVFGLTGVVLAYRSWLCFAALAVLMLSAAINWQVVASGMIGL